MKTARKSGTNQSFLFRLFRAASAFLLLGLLLWYVGFSDLLSALAEIELRYVVYLVLLSVVLIWVSCLKWQLFIRAVGHDAPVIQLMKYYTSSYFFNLFMPSILGGDVARSYQLGTQLGSYQSVFAATFVERFTGFLAMTLMGVFFVATGVRIAAGVEYAILGVAFVTLSAALIFFSPTLTNFSSKIALRLVRLLPMKGLPERLERLIHAIVAAFLFARNNNSLFFKAMGYSFVFHLFAVLNTYVCARAVGWDNADFGGLCVIVPLVLLVSVAPITPSGIGIQEGAFLYFLTRIGATHAQGLGVGVVLRAKGIITAIVGGLIWYMSRERRAMLVQAHSEETSPRISATEIQR